MITRAASAGSEDLGKVVANADDDGSDGVDAAGDESNEPEQAGSALVQMYVRLGLEGPNDVSFPEVVMENVVGHVRHRVTAEECDTTLVSTSAFKFSALGLGVASPASEVTRVDGGGGLRGAAASPPIGAPGSMAMADEVTADDVERSVPAKRGLLRRPEIDADAALGFAAPPLLIQAELVSGIGANVSNVHGEALERRVGHEDALIGGPPEVDDTKRKKPRDADELVTDIWRERSDGVAISPHEVIDRLQH